MYGPRVNTGEARSCCHQLGQGHARGARWAAAGQPDDQEVSHIRGSRAGHVEGGSHCLLLNETWISH